MYILKLRYKAIKFPHLEFFCFCFCLRLSSPLPVFNFLMSSCWQPLYFTSSWHIKHLLWELMLMHKQTRRCVKVFPLPSQTLIKTAFLQKIGQVIQPWTFHAATAYNVLCQIICFVFSKHVVFQVVDLSQLEFRKHYCFLPLPITLQPSGQQFIL